MKKMFAALPLLLGNCVLLFLLLAGGLFSFTSAYEISFDTGVLLAGCLGSAVLCAVLWSVPYGGWAALGLLGTAGLFLRRQWDIYKPALRLLWKVTVQDKRLNRIEEEQITETLLLIVLLLGIVLGWMAVRERCWHLPAVILITPLLPAVVSGTLPDLLPLLAQCAGWLTLLVTSLYSRKEVQSLGKGVWIGLGGVSALLLLLYAALPQEGYTRPQWATNARDALLQTAVKFTGGPVWENSGGNTVGGNLDIAMGVPETDDIDGQIDLTQAGARRYSGDVVLEVICSQTGRMYLRGGASNLYTGRGWKCVASQTTYGGTYLYSGIADNRTACFPAMTAPEGAETKQMHIRHIRDIGNIAYIPYRLLNFPTDQVLLSNEGNGIRTVPDYLIEYIPGGPEDFQPLEGEMARLENGYRSYVQETYLDVPEQTRQALLPLAEQIKKTEILWEPDLPEQFQETAAAAMRTAKVLEETAVYDLNVTPMDPLGEFVEHFLEEKRGYCVHFATTGALLLRMQGIPARYVEGYAPWVTGQDMGDEQAGSLVRDSDAHAWVEVYLDGYGWYPVEMTPGRQGETQSTFAPEILQTEVPEDQEEEEKPDAPEIEHETNDSEKDSQAEEKDEEKTDLRWLWRTVLVLLPGAAVYGVYRAAGAVRRKRLARAGNNQAVIYAYLRYQQLLRWGGPEEPVLEELGRKAKFSQHELSWEERENAWGWVRHAENAVWKTLGTRKRAVFLACFGGET